MSLIALTYVVKHCTHSVIDNITFTCMSRLHSPKTLKLRIKSVAKLRKLLVVNRTHTFNSDLYCKVAARFFLYSELTSRLSSKYNIIIASRIASIVTDHILRCALITHCNNIDYRNYSLKM